MRTLGVAILGLFVGLVLGFLVFSEIVGRLVASNGSPEAPWTFVIGFGPQILAVVGAVLAVALDNRYRARKRKGKQNS